MYQTIVFEIIHSLINKKTFYNKIIHFFNNNEKYFIRNMFNSFTLKNPIIY